jgi:tetratricopeptide (TPR) repeat protein
LKKHWIIVPKYGNMEKGGDELYVAYAINVIGTIYFETADYKKALDYFLQGLVARHAAGDKWGEAGSLDNIGFTYLKLKDYAQAIDYCKQSLEITKARVIKRARQIRSCILPKYIGNRETFNRQQNL